MGQSIHYCGLHDMLCTRTLNNRLLLCYKYQTHAMHSGKTRAYYFYVLLTALYANWKLTGDIAIYCASTWSNIHGAASVWHVKLVSCLLLNE